jgi:nitroimidazol reductase NimA-like FMN-containing flavoprotein (pyridoxamine 5'-phosphate oxidase superfamily)
MSIVVFGRYEELPDKPEYEKERIRAHAFLQKRAMWCEPAYISQEHREQPHSLTPIFFRIHVGKMTGHRATFDKSSTVNHPRSLIDHESLDPEQTGARE